ncbi:MAG: hypothetical protein M3Z04_05110, partial [Chloroflexota bacterium]|nr:hypothetical protein [Chloroflexota bacterium]
LPPTAGPVTGGAAGQPGTDADVQLINDAITATTKVDSYHFSAALNVPGMMQNGTIDGDYLNPDKGHLFLKTAGGSQEIINIGDTSYVKNADGSWRAVSISAAASGLGDATGMGGLGAMAGSLDPSKASNIFGLVGRFAAGINTANKVGTESVDGFTVTHYNVPLFLGNLMGTGGSTTPGETPLGYADLWLDPTTKLVHRLAFKLDLTDLMSAASAFTGPTLVPGAPTPTPIPPIVITADVGLKDFGKPVQFTKPTVITPVK